MPRRRSAPPSDDLESIVGGIAPGEDLAKTERINFMASLTEKHEIQTTAKMFGLTITDYLLRLHRLTVSMMQPRGRRRELRETRFSPGRPRPLCAPLSRKTFGDVAI